MHSQSARSQSVRSQSVRSQSVRSQSVRNNIKILPICLCFTQTSWPIDQVENEEHAGKSHQKEVINSRAVILFLFDPGFGLFVTHFAKAMPFQATFLLSPQKERVAACNDSSTVL